MTHAELCEMISLAQRLLSAGEHAVLSTLFSSRGSTYRRLGSMMVSGPPPLLAGGVSGGCLEQYVARHGRALTQSQPAAILSFDADPDAEFRGQPVLGCGGAIEVLVERLTPDHLSFLRQMQVAHRSDHSSTATCVVERLVPFPPSTGERESEAPPMLINTSHRFFGQATSQDRALVRLQQHSIASRQSRFRELDSRRRALVHYIPSMTRLIVLGAGDDVRSLCTLGRSLGWHVSIADRRARLATKQRFPDADMVLTGEWSDVVRQLVFTTNTAIVMMTHSLPDDIEILPLLAEREFAYLGVLGPAHRRQWLIDGVAKTTALSDDFTARIRGPVGLNLGDRSATGIAISIIAEILADMNGRYPSRLSCSVDGTIRNDELVPHG